MTDTGETTTAPPVERVQRLQRRYRWSLGGLIAALACVAVVGVIIGLTLLTLLDSAHKDECTNRLLADYAASTARALAAPPAPNGERQAAVIDIGRSAARLSRSGEICERGVPKPMVPTPVPTTQGASQ